MRFPRRWVAGAALAAALLAVGAFPAAAQTNVLTENFGGDPVGSSYTDGQIYQDGLWVDVWNGANKTGTRGSQKIVAAGDVHALQMTTAPDLRKGDQHSVLSVSSSSYTPTQLTFQFVTTRQLSLSTPRPWQVSWVLWNYQDSNHFYSLLLKPNGWEISKEVYVRGGQSQVFLATGSSPAFPIGTTYTAQIAQTVNASGQPTFTVNVNGNYLVTVTDTDTTNPPMTSGRIGDYNEDSQGIYYLDAVSQS